MIVPMILIKMLTDEVNSFAIIRVRDCTGRTPLHFAAACGHVGILGALIHVAGTTSVVDNHGYTPLHWACFNGKQDGEVFIHICGTMSSYQV